MLTGTARTLRPNARALKAAGLLLAAGAVPASTRPSHSAAPPVVTVTAREYAFDVPDSIPSGPTTIRLVSKGREQHFVWIARIASPHTLAEYKGTLGAPGTPSWITPVGGVGTLEPGGIAAATIDLAPGLYVLSCDMTNHEGTPHLKLGMLRTIVVTKTGNGAAMPAADLALSLTDFAFTLPPTLRAGDHVVAVRNAGSLPHMALLWRLHRGKSATDVARWLEASGDPGPAPVTLVGGTPDLAPGRQLELPLRLEPGAYLFICLVDDGPGQRAHYQRGMIREITVTGAAAP